MIAESDRQRAIELIAEAVAAGARCFRACEVLEIDVRTLQRWKRALKLAIAGDRRKAAGNRSFGRVVDTQENAVN